MAELSRRLIDRGCDFADEDYLHGLASGEIEDPPPAFFRGLEGVLDLEDEELIRLLRAFFVGDQSKESAPRSSPLA